MAISEIDTRALTIILREKGSQNAAIVTDDSLTPAQALELAHGYQFPLLKAEKNSVVYANPEPALAHVIVVDTGVKEGILQCLAQYPIKISVVPHDISFHDLIAQQPDGILLSNGPGDPESFSWVIELAQSCLHAKLPIFGICLGHQILALALGAKTKKMKFGHHGANHPIQCHDTGVVFISSQNHNFVVDEATLPTCLKVTHSSLFDGTIAGLQHRSLPAFSFQGHPEASPGPRELSVIFEKFIHEVTYAKKS